MVAFLSTSACPGATNPPQASALPPPATSSAIARTTIESHRRTIACSFRSAPGCLAGIGRFDGDRAALGSHGRGTFRQPDNGATGLPTFGLGRLGRQPVDSAASVKETARPCKTRR